MSWDSQNEVDAKILRFTLDEAQCCFTVGTRTTPIRTCGDLRSEATWRRPRQQPSASPSLGARKVNQSSRSCAYSDRVLTRGCVPDRAAMAKTATATIRRILIAVPLRSRPLHYESSCVSRGRGRGGALG